MVIGILSSIMATFITNRIINYFSFKEKFFTDFEEYIRYIGKVQIYLNVNDGDYNHILDLLLTNNNRPITLTFSNVLNNSDLKIIKRIDKKFNNICDKINKSLNRSKLNMKNLKLKIYIDKFEEYKLILIGLKEAIRKNYFMYRLKKKVIRS